ncbi:MAG: twin-arginine translocase TatA/TatE family subunit [Thermoleophilia bacterium]|nr:twin-arginine translocase TatA/TatE family subunit [Thermoleophilia bacterium]
MDFSPIQLLIVLLIVLVVFGAKRLPEIGRSMGSSAREFKKGITGEEESSSSSVQRSEPNDAERS